MLSFKLLKPNAKLPARTTRCSAGLDLFVSDTVTVNRFGPTLIPHGIAWSPTMEQVEGSIRPRSSSAIKRGLHVVYGTVDSDYRGEISSVVFDMRPLWRKLLPIKIAVGERVSQLVVTMQYFMPVSETVDLGPSPRGANGFGSSGK